MSEHKNASEKTIVLESIENGEIRRLAISEADWHRFQEKKRGLQDLLPLALKTLEEILNEKSNKVGVVQAKANLIKWLMNRL